MKHRILILTGILFAFMTNACAQSSTVTHEFNDLPYAYNALEPYIDAQTMELHYDKHHRGYYTKFLAAVKDTEYENQPLAEIFSKISSLDKNIRNNGGGYYNHSLFWENMSPDGGNLSEEMSTLLIENFGSVDDFKAQFSKAAATVFGSGWAWLVLSNDGKLVVSSTSNQDNPLMNDATVQGTPLLALDVWEHAYYLKYQNKRTDYIDSFWNVVNWDTVFNRYRDALK